MNWILTLNVEFRFYKPTDVKHAIRNFLRCSFPHILEWWQKLVGNGRWLFASLDLNVFQKDDQFQCFHRSIHLWNSILYFNQVFNFLLFPFNKKYIDFFIHSILCAECWKACNIRTDKSCWLFKVSQFCDYVATNEKK